MRTEDDIISLYQDRVKERGPALSRMRQARDFLQGHITIPLPELDTVEFPAVANLGRVGKDQLARDVSGYLPDVVFPSLRPGIQVQDEAARTRRAAVFGWWHKNRMQIKIRQRAHHLLAYGTTPVYLTWDGTPEEGRPEWQVRDPLGCYPAPTSGPADVCPSDVVFAYQRSYKWLKDKGWHEALAKIGVNPSDVRPDTMFDLVEYCDDEQVRVIVLRQKRTDDYDTPSGKGVTVNFYLNPTQMCLAVVPTLVSLDELTGLYDGMIGPFFTRSMLTSLEIHAVKRGIFPETWWVGDGQQVPNIITEADGVRGVIGKVSGGRMEKVTTDPGFMTNPTIDRLERAEKIIGGVSAEFYGEAGSNVRTQRRAEGLISASIDPIRGEVHGIFEASLEEENVRAVALSKKVQGSRKVSMYVPTKSARGEITFNPSDLWVTSDHVIKYAFAGSNTADLVIEGAQRVGAELMSKHSFRVIDPLIEDPEAEGDRIVAERLMNAWLTSVEQNAANPEGPWSATQIARLMDLIVTNKKSPMDAVAELQKEIQAEQAAPLPEGAPEAMPGLDGQIPAAIAEPPEAQGNLATLLRQLNTGAMAAR